MDLDVHETATVMDTGGSSLVLLMSSDSDVGLSPDTSLSSMVLHLILRFLVDIPVHHFL